MKWEIMGLRETLNEALKTAMKAHEKDKVGTFRLIFAEIKQKEVDTRTSLDDNQILAILEKMIKQRKDSIAQFEQANRHDLADKEKAECAQIQSFMPQALTDAQIAQLIAQAIESVQTQSGKSGAGAMGAVIAQLRPQVAGRADMAAVSAKVKLMLG